MTMKVLTRALASAVFVMSNAAWAGPPFLTDDPEPTDTGRWEIYAPMVEAEGRGVDFQGAAGAEINYGAAPDLQLTVGLPIDYLHDSSGWQWGRGDIELSAKYRFFHDETAGFSMAFFPGLTLPTGSNGMGNGKVTALLPIWLQKDVGDWSVFGGGGYAINPGAGNHDYWTGGVALTRQIDEHLSLGIEADRQGSDTNDGNGSTSLGIGATYQLPAPFRILASAGPTFEDHAGTAGFHLFLALAEDF